MPNQEFSIATFVVYHRPSFFAKAELLYRSVYTVMSHQITDSDISSIASILIEPDGSINADHEDPAVPVAKVTLWSDGTVTVAHWMYEFIGEPEYASIRLTNAQAVALQNFLAQHLITA